MKSQLPAPARNRLATLLARSACYVEYGSGGSTQMAVEAGVPHVFSVESAVVWAEKVKQMRKRHPESKTNLRMVNIDLGPVARLGYPIETPDHPEWPEYALRVWNSRRGYDPDLVLVDGRFRVACWAASMLYAKPGTVILFDDYLDRDYYEIVQWVVEPVALHARMAEFVVPADLDRERVWLLMTRYVGDTR